VCERERERERDRRRVAALGGLPCSRLGKDHKLPFIQIDAGMKFQLLYSHSIETPPLTLKKWNYCCFDGRCFHKRVMAHRK